MAYYITGDCHGVFDKLIWFARYNKLTEEDVIILLGDVGLNYYGNEADYQKKKILVEFPNIFFCIHGNHEERPFNIKTYQEREWKKGVIYYEPEFPNILFAKDGEIYEFDGKKAIVIGGAYSVDKEYRLAVGIPWFSDEQPSEKIKKLVEDRLTEANWRIDYVLTHTSPLLYEPIDLFLDFIDQSKVDKSTEHWFSYIQSRLNYSRWYFAHYHENREFNQATMLFEEIQELGKSGFVQRIGRPKYKMGELVLFYISYESVEHECYGRICCIEQNGTLHQKKETSYDIEGPDFKDPSSKIVYKHICESELQSMNELKEMWK